MNADETPTTDAQPSERAGRTAGVTRRSVLEHGVAGLAAGALGTAGSAPVGAQSAPVQPPAPENLRTDGEVGERGAIAWDWPGDPCSANLSQFTAEVRADSEESSYAYDHTVEPTTPVLPIPDGILDEDRAFESFDVTVFAVDGDGTQSPSVSSTFSTTDSDHRYLLELDEQPKPVQPGGTGTATVSLQSLTDDATTVERVEFEVGVSASCVASVSDVEPAAPGVDLAHSEMTDDGGALVAVEGAAELDGEPLPIAELELTGGDHGETFLDLRVEGAELVVQASDHVLDSVPESELAVRGTTVDVTPGFAPPEELQEEWWVHNSIGLTWDWPGDRCDGELSHFLVSERFDDRTEVHRVPSGSPAFVAENTLEEQRVVAVRAVSKDGDRSVSVSTRELGGHTDVFGQVEVAPPADSVPVGESIDVPVEKNLRSDIAQFEVAVSLSSTCAATITDAWIPHPGVDVLDAQWAPDDGAVTIHGQGAPGGTGDRNQLVVVELTGHAAGGATVDVSYEEILLWDSDATVDEDLQLPRDDFDAASRDDTLTTGGVETWETVRVGEPPLPAVGEAEPRDLNGDGYYRDVDGDGSVGQSDVAAFFRNQHRDAWKRSEYFDFSGNGDVTHGDVVELFDYVALES